MTNQNFRKLWPAVVLAGGIALGMAANGVYVSAQDSPATQDAATPGQRTDGQIEMDVVHALDADASLKQDWITAATVQGEVTLSGTSASDANRQLAESIAGELVRRWKSPDAALANFGSACFPWSSLPLAAWNAERVEYLVPR